MEGGREAGSPPSRRRLSQHGVPKGAHPRLGDRIWVDWVERLEALSLCKRTLSDSLGLLVLPQVKFSPPLITPGMSPERVRHIDLPDQRRLKALFRWIARDQQQPILSGKRDGP